MAIIALLVFFLAAYLLGSVPFGYVCGRFKGVDIRQLGSRNIGATNCWRVCGWQFGLPAFLLDVAKGLAATAGAWLMVEHCPLQADLSAAGQNLVLIGAALAAVLGHVFPLYLKFRGGKAVATSLGTVLGIPGLRLFALAAFVIWVLVFAATRYVSVASTAAALVLLTAQLALNPVTLRFDAAGPWQERWPLTLLVAAIVLLVLVRHRENYRRLMNGTEHKFSRKQK